MIDRACISITCKCQLRCTYCHFDKHITKASCSDITAENLEAILKNVTQKSIIKAIESELEWRKTFTGLSASYIKHAGMRLKCSKKSFEYVSSSNREKAKATNIKRWLKIAQSPENPPEWLMNFKKGETRICLLHNESDLRKM